MDFVEDCDARRQNMKENAFLVVYGCEVMLIQISLVSDQLLLLHAKIEPFFHSMK